MSKRRRAPTAAVIGLLLLAPLTHRAGAASAEEGRWIPSLTVKPQGEIQLSLFEDGTAFAYNTNDTPLWYSPNSGANWVPLPPPPSDGGTPSIDFASPDLGYTLSNGTIFVTRDKALTWTRADGPSVPPRPDAEWQFAAIDGMEAVLGTKMLVLSGRGFYVKNGCPVVPDETLLFSSTDLAGTWDTTQVNFPSTTREIEFLDKRNGIALLWEMQLAEKRECGHSMTSFRSSVQVTRDGARSFREVYSVFHEDEDAVMAVAMPTRGKILLGMASGRILISRNGGRSFREVGSLSNQLDQEAGTDTGLYIDALTFGTRRIGYAGTNGMGTWRTEDGGKTWFMEPSHQSLAGLNIGDIAAVGPDQALAGGAWAVARRVTD